MMAFLAALLPARADTVFYFSKPESRYGACYGCQGNGNEVAHSYCADGGSACTPVLYCNGGWAAVAFSAPGGNGGVALSCGYTEAVGAETTALTNCIVVANWYCNLVQLADPDGNITDLKGSNTFLVAFLTQALLQLIGYDAAIDDHMTPQAVTALQQFQAKFGRPPTGVSNMDEIWYLEVAAGGRQRLFDNIRKFFVDPSAAQDAPYVFAWAPAQAPNTSFGNELMQMTLPVRLLAVATHLTALDHPCTSATKAEVPFGDPDALWLVECKEASYDVMMLPDGGRTVIEHPK